MPTIDPRTAAYMAAATDEEGDTAWHAVDETRAPGFDDRMVVGTLVTGFYVIDRNKRLSEDRCKRVSPVFNRRSDALAELTAMRRETIR